MASPKELLELMQGPQFGQPQAAPSFSAPAPTAIDPPQVGPTIANDPQAPVAQPEVNYGFDEFGRSQEEVNRLQQMVQDTAPVKERGFFEILGGAVAGPGAVTAVQSGKPQSIINPRARQEQDPFTPFQPFVDPSQRSAEPQAPAVLAEPEAAPVFNPGGYGMSSLSPQAISEIQTLNEQPVEPSQPTQPSDPLQGFTAAGGQPLSEFLAGGTQLRGRGDSGAAGEAAMQAHGELAGTRARPDGTFAEPRRGVARGPDSTDRAAGELSMADAVDLAGGDREKARAMVVASRQPKKEDTRTPEKIESDRLAVEAQKKQNEILDQEIARGRDPNSTPAEKESAALAQGVKDGTITPAQANEAKKQKLLGKPPGLYDTWAEYELATMTDADGDGKVATEDEAAEAAPFDPSTLSGKDKSAYEWARANPDNPKAAKILKKLGA